jgi:hypothetical protein
VDGYGVATPVDWQDGEDVIIPPAVSQEDAEKKFTKGVKVIKPYLRYTHNQINNSGFTEKESSDYLSFLFLFEILLV